MAQLSTGLDSSSEVAQNADRRAAALTAGCGLVRRTRLCGEGDVRVCTALCATRPHEIERRWKGSAAGLSQPPGEAGGSLILGARVRAGAAPTTARRVGT